VPDEIQTAIDKLDDGSLESLKRESELGDLHFGSVVDKLRAIRSMLEAFAQEHAEELPSGVVSGANGQIAQLDVFWKGCGSSPCNRTIRTRNEARSRPKSSRFENGSLRTFVRSYAGLRLEMLFSRRS